MSGMKYSSFFLAGLIAILATVTAQINISNPYPYPYPYTYINSYTYY
jgi:hypothetical protein